MNPGNHCGDLEKYHSKCVCQTCTCHKHKCPPADINYPFKQTTLYQNNYHEHPINLWKKPPPQQPQPYQPYEDLKTSYQVLYPGHEPQITQKMVPKVQDENKNRPFYGNTEYRQKFPPKTTQLEKPSIKDTFFAPCKQPFQGTTTYNSNYPKKRPNIHEKKSQPDCQFPEGYGFNGSTIYKDSYKQKSLPRCKSYKPIQTLGTKRKQQLSTIYRDDYKKQPLGEKCPILRMPKRKPKLEHPCEHLVFNKNSNKWQQK